MEDKEAYHYRLLHKGRVKGRSELVTLVEIICIETDPMATNKMATKKIYEKSMRQFHDRNYAAALAGFQEVSITMPDDAATLNYIERAAMYLADGIPHNSDGIETLDFKMK